MSSLCQQAQANQTPTTVKAAPTIALYRKPLKQSRFRLNTLPKCTQFLKLSIIPFSFLTKSQQANTESKRTNSN